MDGDSGYGQVLSELYPQHKQEIMTKKTQLEKAIDFWSQFMQQK